MVFGMTSGGGGGTQAYNEYFANTADIPATIDFGFAPQVIYIRYKRTSGSTNDYVAIIDLSINTSKKYYLYGSQGWSSVSSTMSDMGAGAPEVTISGTTISLVVSDMHSCHIVAVPSAS